MLIKKGYENGSTAVWVQGSDKPLRIGLNLRVHFGFQQRLDYLPDGWEAELPITYDITKFDSDLPCYVHQCVIHTPAGDLNGYLIGDHGMRTGCYPVLKLA